ncbi:MAG TPA: tetratricopeptide repeat protein, partial [bacterium]
DPNYKDSQLQLQELQNARRPSRTAADFSLNENNKRPSPSETTAARKQSLSASEVVGDTQEPIYKEGLSHMVVGDWQTALTSFERLTAINPNYRDLRTLIKASRDSLAQQQQLALSQLYDEGLIALQNGEWRQAVLTFEKVQDLDPAYGDVRNKLADARFNASKSPPRGADRKPAEMTLRWIPIAGWAVVLLIFSSGVIFVFTPTMRARFNLLQGKYDRAAALYEGMLQKNPGKIKLYPFLANIYLLEKRRDERALKVYETILRLNILTNKREEITSILANHYLNQGRTDMSAIQIMEKELDSKMRRMKVYP